MEKSKFEQEGNNIYINLPLTQPTGKIRVKERSFFSEYGIPFSARKNKISLKNYIEWQIGYDMLANEDNISKTKLSKYEFTNYKGERKIPYELAEILYFSYKNGLISIESIKETYKEITEISDNKMLDVIDEMQITRTNPIKEIINEIEFYKMKVSYPLIVHKFKDYDIYAEIINREKQRAVGVQPMLYVCLPITTLQYSSNPINRVLNAKECGKWMINKDEAELSLELFRIFGMLSKKHKFDVMSIFKTLFNI